MVAGKTGKNEKVEQPAAVKPTCFVIMPISDVPGYGPGHFSRVYEYLLRPSIEAAGFEAVRADDEIKTDYIVTGIIKKIVESDMVLCDISTKNPNVMYELGIRHAFEKKVAIIKDKSTEKIFDIQGLRYYEYTESLRIDAVNNDIAKIKEIILKTYHSKEDDFNSVVSLAMIQPANLPHTKELNKELKFVLGAINDLEKKLTPSNRKIHSYMPSNKIRYVELNNDVFKTGGLIFDSKLNEIGRIIDIEHYENFITVTKNEEIFTITFDDVINNDYCSSQF